MLIEFGFGIQPANLSRYPKVAEQLTRPYRNFIVGDLAHAEIITILSTTLDGGCHLFPFVDADDSRVLEISRIIQQELEIPFAYQGKTVWKITN